MGLWPNPKEAGMRDTTIDDAEGRLTVGLDVGDTYTQACVLDEAGEVIEESRVATTPKAFRRRFATMPPARLVLEAGNHSHWASRLLGELGHEVIVANPRMLRFIYGSDSKNDKADAAYLARVGKLDPALLHPVVHRSEQCQADRALLRSRQALVRTRASLITHARGLVKIFGAKLPHCSTDAFVRKASEHVPDILRAALDPVFEIIASVSAQIRELDRQVEALAQERYPETRLLSQVPGVGSLTALAYVLTVEDPARFERARAIGSYLGLRPRQADSGVLKPQLRITKAGDEMLRGLLVECTQHMLGSLGPDTDLKRWGLKLAERGGKAAKKRAVVAMARKLSVLLLRLWVTGEVYEPLRNARVRGELVPTTS
jgi:transposase